MFGIIYLATNIENKKQYVGQTIKSLEERWGKHVQDARLSRDNCYLHNALRKHGKSVFSLSVLHLCETKEEMNFVEMFYIHFLSTKFPDGYNLTDGGEGKSGSKHTEESKRKMSESSKGQAAWNKGLKMPEEAKKRLSLMTKGRVPWNKGKKDLQVGWLKGTKGLVKAWNKGLNLPPLSDDHKQKLSVALTGQKRSEEDRIKISEGLKVSWSKNRQPRSPRGANGRFLKNGKRQSDRGTS